MTATVTKTRAALRALYEGATPTFSLLADAGRLTEVRLACRARREGWIEGGTARKQTARLQKQIERLEAQIDRLMKSGDDTAAGFDKAKLDLLGLLLRSIEKLKDMMPSEPEQLKVKIRERDDRVSKILQHLNDRVSELARYFAAKMVEADRRG